ncbi:unnamed protein product, partial [Effrenium voratum]
ARQDMGTTQHFPRAAPGSFWGDRRSLLLGANACDPNAMDDRGDTALHLAAGNGDKGACQLLLSNARVDRSLQDDAGRTALDVAHSAAAHYFATEAVHALAM